MHVGNKQGLLNQNIVDTAMFLNAHDSDQSNLFLETAKLSETFFEQLQRHPVPIDEPAIKAINNNSMALDLYCWLTYRLHALGADRPISWKALHTQFGAGFVRLDHFRTKFTENLHLALAVYPNADVKVEAKGLILKPSPPPIAPRSVAVVGMKR